MQVRKILLVLSYGFATMAFGAGDLDKITKGGQQRTQEGAAAQGKVGNVSDATSDIISDYKTVTKIVDGLKVYNDLLELQIANQNKEAASIQESIENVSTLGRHVVPLMTRMIDSLEHFVQLDVPFLSKERTSRVKKLREMMVRADVSDAEKFRRVIEAYQVESDYGRTIESYRGSLTFGDRTQEVDFLRVGRVALLYQSIGGETTGAWDAESKQWLELSAADYKQHVTQGIRIARKQVAPDLLVLPIAAAKEVSQ